MMPSSAQADTHPPAFSISLGPAKPKPAPRKPAPTFAPKRSAAHLDSDDEDHPDDSQTSKVQLVTGFDSKRGGALDLDDAPKKDSGPLVIPKLSNRNWREEAERRRGGKKAIYLPPEALAKQQNGGAVVPEDLVETDKTEQKYGLQVFERASGGLGPEPPVLGGKDVPPPPPKTEEEIALSALLRGDAPAASTLVLAPTASSNGNDWRAARAAVNNEDAAFKTDVASRPEMATLEDYAAVPVEEFGAALLRGMGWKEGDEVGKRRGAQAKPRVVEKRPAFLGIGAKPKEEIPELGTWGKGDRRKNRRVDTTYIPVVMIDKKTGKIVDPAEAEKETGANGKGKGERGEQDEPPKRERSRDRDRRAGDRDRKDLEWSYDSSDRRRRDRERSRDRGGRDKDRDRSRDRGGRDRDRERRKDEDRDRRRGDDRRRDDRRDRDRRDRR